MCWNLRVGIMDSDIVVAFTLSKPQFQFQIKLQPQEVCI